MNYRVTVLLQTETDQVKRLLQELNCLLASPDLNLDELEFETQQTIESARVTPQSLSLLK